MKNKAKFTRKIIIIQNKKKFPFEYGNRATNYKLFKCVEIAAHYHVDIQITLSNLDIITMGLYMGFEMCQNYMTNYKLNDNKTSIPWTPGS